MCVCVWGGGGGEGGGGVGYKLTKYTDYRVRLLKKLMKYLVGVIVMIIIIRKGKQEIYI